MRPSCLNCARKHLAQALILLTEHRLGYGGLWFWLAIGHMAECEAELLREHEEIAIDIRTRRKRLENEDDFDPQLDQLIERLCDVEQNSYTTTSDTSSASE
jgi:hypothetical protein